MFSGGLGEYGCTSSIGNPLCLKPKVFNISRCIQRGQKCYLILGSYGLVSGETSPFLGLFSGSFLTRPLAALFPIEIFGMAAANLAPALGIR
jgi:hypothetical protein